MRRTGRFVASPSGQNVFGAHSLETFLYADVSGTARRQHVQDLSERHAPGGQEDEQVVEQIGRLFGHAVR